jgi:AraC-like DNA-binding protein
MAAQVRAFGGARFCVAGNADFRRWSRDPVGMDFCVFSCGWYAAARGMAWQRRDRAEGVLIYCVGGRGVYRQDGVPWKVGPGDLLYCPPHTRHAYASDAKHPWTIYWAHLSGAKLAAYEGILGLGGRFPPVRRIGIQARMAHQFQALLRLHRPPYDRRRMLALQGCALDLLGLIASTPASMSEHTKETLAIQQAVERVEESLNQPFDLDAHARRAGYSRWHFGRLFKLVTGEPPLAYHNRRRLEQARSMLAAGLAVGDVARSLGYTDPYYFSRFFKKHVGQAPSHFARKARAAAPGRISDTPQSLRWS